MTKTLTAGAVAALASFAGLAGPAPCVDAKAPAKKIRVVIVDGQNNHDWRATTPLLKKILEDTGRFTVDVSSNLKPGDRTGTVQPTAPFPPDLGSVHSGYDVLLSNYNGAAWPEGFRKELETRLADGRIGLVIVHAANNAFGDWAEYNRMIGLGWRGSGAGDRLVLDAGGKELRSPKGAGPGAGHGAKHAFRVTVRDPDHAITRGMPHEWMHAADELYHGLRGPAADMHVLATAYSARDKGGTGEHEPMIWTLSYGKGRVFHTPMGHDTEAMRCLGFVGTLTRGTEWAATGAVTLSLPDGFPTAAQTSSLPR
jgi:hypothetical protein